MNKLKFIFWSLPLLLLILLFGLVVDQGARSLWSLWNQVGPTLKPDAPNSILSLESAAFTRQERTSLKNQSEPIEDSTKGDQASDFCLKVPVLIYHHIRPYDQSKTLEQKKFTVEVNYFDRQMKYLVDQGYQALTAEDLVQALRKRKTLSGKPVVITLDDGYKDAYIYAFPIAKKYGLILNLMISAGFIGDPDYLSWAELKEMIGSNLVRVYDQTWSHFPLTRGTDDQAQSEIIKGQAELEKRLGQTVKILTYPYGLFNDRVIEILKKDGFLGAYSIISSTTQCSSRLYNLRRQRIGNADLKTYGL